jgi:hypothetical protein
VTQSLAAHLLLFLVRLLPTEPTTTPPRADFFAAVGLTSRTEAAPDVWKVAEPPAAFAWMNAPGPLPTGQPTSPLSSGNSFQQILERVSPIEDQPRSAALAGVIVDPGRWYYKQERENELYKRKTKLEAPDANEVLVPYASRNWKAQDKVQIPVPIPLAVAEQLFVYGQFDGSGDALSRSSQTSLYGKTGVGVKWTLLAGSELQLRYATLLSYSDSVNPGRFQERVLPAVELNARMPLVGPLELEYTGSAIPAVSRLDTDQFKQELRFAVPLRGMDNELEFGARYRWDLTQETTPWTDRAQLFLGVKLRR